MSTLRPGAGNSTHQKIAVLEIGRFVSAMLVTVAHLMGIINTQFAVTGQPIFGGWRAGTVLPLNLNGFAVYAGEIGVQFFFVLSGFVMITAHSHDFGKAKAVFRFWWRRASRIFPTYWLALIIAVLTVHTSLSHRDMVKNIFLYPWQTNLAISTAWSLTYEVAFYVMFGLCLLPRIGKVILVFWIVISVWRWCPDISLSAVHLSLPTLRKLLPNSPLDPRAVDNRIFSYLAFYFFSGMGAGSVFVKWKTPAPIYLALCLAATVWAFFILPPLQSYGPYLLPPMAVLQWAVALSAIVLALAGLERQLLPNANSKIGRLGAISYPLYILQAPLILAACALLPPFQLSGLQLYLLFYVFLFFVCLVSIMITIYFDLPVQGFLRARFAPFKK